MRHLILAACLALAGCGSVDTLGEFTRTSAGSGAFKASYPDGHECPDIAFQGSLNISSFRATCPGSSLEMTAIDPTQAMAQSNAALQQTVSSVTGLLGPLIQAYLGMPPQPPVVPGSTALSDPVLHPTIPQTINP